MNRFSCNDNYLKDFKTYTEVILEKTGIASQSAEREIMCMADTGNLVAIKLYADMVFYRKLFKKNHYREAFLLYMKSAGIMVDNDGNWECSGNSYPLSFWTIGYCLVNYRRESLMKECELIEVIDRMSLTERFQTALELAASCLNYVDSAGAVNLIGRILHEVSEDEELFSALKPVIERNIADRVFVKIPLKVEACSDIQKCSAVAEQFFLTAAKLGYVYASNNLAVREAERIVAVSRENKEDPSIGESISRYIEYLKLSADKYEPYAANRLGLFYITGEVRGISGSYSDRSYIDTALAKEYFIRATVYPNENSAWAFFNLIKYFHKDYDNNLELLNEHMDYIKVLNPKVYDIAIEL